AVLVPGSILYWAMTTSRIDMSSYRVLLTYFAPTYLAILGLVPLVILAGLAYALRRAVRRRVRIVLGCLTGLVGVVVLISAFAMTVAFAEYAVAVAVLGLATIGAVWTLLRRTGPWQLRSAHVPFAALLLVAVFLAGMHEIATLWNAAYSEPPMRGMGM